MNKYTLVLNTQRCNKVIHTEYHDSQGDVLNICIFKCEAYKFAKNACTVCCESQCTEHMKSCVAHKFVKNTHT